jgi:type VI secretion system protein VasJ
MSVDDVLAETKGRLEAMLAPINGGVGDDASYDESFEAIKTEIDKVNSLEGGKTEWPTVASLAESLLSEKSKDFRVALYYGAGAAMTAGLRGVLDGLVVLLELSNAFWEPMYPALKRPRARGNLCSWYVDIALPVVQSATPTAKDRGMVQAIDKVFGELDGLLAERLGEAYPGMGPLRDQIRSLVNRVPADAPPPPPPPPPVSQPQPSASSGDGGYAEPQVDYVADTNAPAAGGGGVGIGPDDIVDPGSAYQALQQLVPLIGRAADIMLGSDPTGPDGFRLARAAANLMIGGTPYNEGGGTQIDGPREHVVSALNDMLGAGDWQNLMTTAQQLASEYPLWLDAARALATALENLGPDYAKARDVVVKETAALLARAPELPTLSFADGTPMANADTQAWCGSLGGGGGGGGGGKSPVDKAVAEAEKLILAEQLPQAIAVLSRVASQAVAPAHRFKARLELGKICLRMQLLDIARAQLEGLERLAEEHRLAAWDPELCAEMYANLYRVRKAVSAQNYEDQELVKKASQSFARLCELDAAQAFKVMQEAG